MAMHKIKFTVIGHGRFPIDMLRYDCCFPYQEVDAQEIARHENGDSEQYPVAIMRYADDKKWRPTEGRWKSMGWNVHPGSLQVDVF